MAIFHRDEGILVIDGLILFDDISGFDFKDKANKWPHALEQSWLVWGLDMFMLSKGMAEEGRCNIRGRTGVVWESFWEAWKRR